MSFDIKKGLTLHHHHVSLTIIFLIILLVALALLIKPAFIGYKLSKDLGDVGLDAASVVTKLDSLKSNLLITNTSLISCEALGVEHFNSLNEEKSALLACLDDKRQLQSDAEILQSGLRANATNLELENIQLKSTYAEIVSNAANNICCKNRIDNPEIDSYLLANGRIVCTVGEPMQISC